MTTGALDPPPHLTLAAHRRVEEIATILTLVARGKSRQIAPDAVAQLAALLEQHTDASTRSKFNGRLCDVLLQFADTEMDQRLAADPGASGDALVTYTLSDIVGALERSQCLALLSPTQKACPVLDVVNASRQPWLLRSASLVVPVLVIPTPIGGSRAINRAPRCNTHWKLCSKGTGSPGTTATWSRRA
jgi:hypothetical protein